MSRAQNNFEAFVKFDLNDEQDTAALKKIFMTPFTEHKARGLTRVHVSVGKGDIEDVKRKMKVCGSDLMSLTSKDGYTPLMFAILKGHVKIARLLIDAYGEDFLFQRTRGGLTMMHLAATAFTVDSAKFLFEVGWGQLLFWLDDDGKTPAQLAKDERTECRELFHDLEQIHRSAGLGNTAKVMSCVKQCGKEVLHLMTSEGATPLVHALRGGHVDLARLMIETCGVELLHAQEDDGSTVMHAAARSPTTASIELLIELGHGDLLLVQDVAGKTPADRAKENSFPTEELLTILTNDLSN